jgi:hypothetical protein
LGCLIHRTADEEDPFSHSRPPPLLITDSYNNVSKIERRPHSRRSTGRPHSGRVQIDGSLNQDRTLGQHNSYVQSQWRREGVFL